MGGVAAIVRAEVRNRWRALLLLGVLGGLVGATVLGALVGARRTGTAFDRLVSSTSFWDAEVIGDSATTEKAATLDEVTSSWPLFVKVGFQQDDDSLGALGVFAGPSLPEGHYEPIVVRGRRADPRSLTEVVVSELTAKTRGFDLGDSIEWRGYTPAQFRQEFEEGKSAGEPAGPAARFDVVGIIRDANDALTFDLTFILTTPAFYEQVAPQAGGFDLMTVHLRRGAAGMAAFRRDVAAIDETAGITSFHDTRGTVDSAASVAVRALLVLAAVAMLAGVVALAQATSRSLSLRAEDLEVERALGMSRLHRLLALGLPYALTIALATLVTTGGAIVASSLTAAVGHGLEPHPGLAVNVAFLAVGDVGVAVVLAVIVTLASLVHLRRHDAAAPPRASSLVSRVAGAGAPVALVVGANLAVEPRGSTSGVPTRSTLVGAALGTLGLVAALAVLASLQRTAATPARYGWTQDLSIQADAGEQGQAVIDALVADDRLSDVVFAVDDDVSINGEAVSVVGLEAHKGSAARTVLRGRMPASAQEIALGPTQTADVRADVGDNLTARGADGSPTQLVVVGVALVSDTDYGSRATLTMAGLNALERSGAGDTTTQVYVTVAPGADPVATRADLAKTHGVEPPTTPAELTNLADASGVMRLLAGFLAVLAVLAIAHAMAVVVRRRGNELAILHALGMTGRQLRASLRAASAVLTGSGLLLGAPLGAIVGSFVWIQLADGVHVPNDPSLPLRTTAGIAALALAGAAALGSLPGARLTRRSSATTLRTE
jgi:putative ABC transport system permease protein